MVGAQATFIGQHLAPFTSPYGGPKSLWIRNPGYNRDRGPATVVSLRLNLRY